jgi:ATP-binding cassette subfamily C protein
MSGGERQRLCVARALYHDPEVLIFDEATALLDDRTERELADEIERLRGKKTLIVVAHRPQAMQRCDRLVLLEAGSVVAVDSYDQLAPWLEGRAPRLATLTRSATPGRQLS